jgi:formate hydrogenlyase subunit 6/NADH:ubiquinone oxidoreductase subunit I
MSAIAPQVQPTRCVRYRYRYSACRRCADACPHEALALSEEGVAIDVTRCQNCALCTSACLTAALVAGNLARVELLKRAIKQPQFSFACAPSGAEADAIVPCLGALDAPTLAYLAWRGIAVELKGHEHCARCEHGAQGAMQRTLNLDAVAALQPAASAWTLPHLSDTGTGASRREFQAGRRQLFRRLAGRGLEAALRTGGGDQPVTAKAIRAGTWFLPEGRELLQIVFKAPPDAAASWRSVHDVLPLMHLEHAPGCTACDACTRVCPTGALQVCESVEEWVLRFTADHCVACGVCVEVCQPRALCTGPQADVNAGRPAVALQRLRKQRCSRCDRFFVSPGARANCTVCDDDDTAFERIFG